MNIFDKRKGAKIIKKVARQHGVSESHVRAEMQRALDEAWESDNPITKQRQRELFPDGKPSVEEFILTVARQI